MKKSLFPKEFINASVEHYTFRKRSISIYTVLVLSVAAIIASLPFISVEVSTSVAGLISTEENRYDINTAVGGFILQNKLEEGKSVTKGDTLLVLDNSVLKKELSQVNNRLLESNQFLADLTSLISHEKYPPCKFKSKVSDRFFKI